MSQDMNLIAGLEGKTKPFGEDEAAEVETRFTFELRRKTKKLGWKVVFQPQAMKQLLTSGKPRASLVKLNFAH
jgi:hypothetical protein